MRHSHQIIFLCSLSLEKTQSQLLQHAQIGRKLGARPFLEENKCAQQTFLSSFTLASSYLPASRNRWFKSVPQLFPTDIKALYPAMTAGRFFFVYFNQGLTLCLNFLHVASTDSTVRLLRSGHSRPAFFLVRQISTRNDLTAKESAFIPACEHQQCREAARTPGMQFSAHHQFPNLLLRVRGVF